MTGTRSITGFSWAIDNQIVDHADAEFLRECHRHEWIYLQTPDGVEYEMHRASDLANRERLLQMRSEYAMPAGTFVLNFSHLGSGLLATDSQVVNLHLVHEIIWARAFELDAECSETNRRALRRVGDTHIVATTIYNAIRALVTTDSRILAAGQVLSWVYPGFEVLTIERATELAKDGIWRARKMAVRDPNNMHYQDLPSWPAS